MRKRSERCWNVVANGRSRAYSRCLGIGVSLLLALGAAAAEAVPVASTATLTVRIPGSDPFDIVGSGTVDVIGSTIVVPAGMVSLSTSVVVPVTSSTAIASISASHLSNLTGTFSLGGAALAGETCPPAPDSACVNGGGLGGVMALTGTVFVAIIPDIVVIPVNLNEGGFGQGGSTTSPFTYDAAPWTTGTAQVRTASGTFLLSGNSTAQLGLVTPAYVSALGNVSPIFLTFDLESLVIGPEPGTGLLLLTAGAAGLAAVRRRRR